MFDYLSMLSKHELDQGLHGFSGVGIIHGLVGPWVVLKLEWNPLPNQRGFSPFLSRGGKIGPARWASSVRPKLGQGRAIKLLARKKSGQIWPDPVWPSPVWPGPVRPNFFLP